MSVFGGTSDGGAAQQEAARQARVRQGMGQIDQNFSQFDDNFYNQAATDYTKAQTPKVMQDYQDTKNNLTYALTRGGNLNSSTATQRNTSLSNTLSENESQIASGAQGAANELRGKVATQKSNLVQNLQSSSDPAAIAVASNAATSQLRAPSPVQPLGNMFADWSNMYLANQYSKSAPPSGSGGIWGSLQNMGYGAAPSAGGSSYLVN